MANAKEIVQDENRAAALGELQNLFEKSYNLNTPAGKQALVEGLKELGKHAAATCSQGTVSLTFGANGLTGISVGTDPIPVV